MKKAIKKALRTFGVDLVKADKTWETYSKLFQKYSEYTMIKPNHYVSNLTLASRFKDIEGCIVECGVWRGGMIAGLAEVFGKDRRYYLFNSFQGLPEPKVIDGDGALEWSRNKQGRTYYDNCKAEISYAKDAMKLTGAHDYQCVEGWFNETIPNFEFNDKIAFLRLDADWYESTMICFQNLYELVATGGCIVIDDYYAWDGCSRAVHDYLSVSKSTSRIYQTKTGVSYIIKKD